MDKAADSFCVLERLHRALRGRDVCAKVGDRWGDPRADLLSGRRWEPAQPRVVTTLGGVVIVGAENPSAPSGRGV